MYLKEGTRNRPGFRQHGAHLHPPKVDYTRSLNYPSCPPDRTIRHQTQNVVLYSRSSLILARSSSVMIFLGRVWKTVAIKTVECHHVTLRFGSVKRPGMFRPCVKQSQGFC